MGLSSSAPRSLQSGTHHGLGNGSGSGVLNYQKFVNANSMTKETFVSKCCNAPAEFVPDGILGGDYQCSQCKCECSIIDPAAVDDTDDDSAD